MPRASASTLSPASASAHESDMTRAELGRFFFAVIYCWWLVLWTPVTFRSLGAQTCPGLGVVLFRHLWARRELLCLHMSWDSCGLFGEKGGRNRLAVRCCGAVAMSFAQRDDGPKWSKCNAWMKWLPCPKRCPKGWGCNIGKDTLLHKSAQTPPKLLSSAVHCYPFPKKMPKKKRDQIGTTNHFQLEDEVSQQ